MVTLQPACGRVASRARIQITNLDRVNTHNSARRVKQKKWRDKYWRSTDPPLCSRWNARPRPCPIYLTVC